MPGKGTTDAIFIARQVQEKHLAKKKELYFAFVDLEKAFDRVPRKVVRWALRVSQVDEWLGEAVMALFEEANTVIRTGAGDSNSFHVKVGVHQGSVLSPLLFAIVMDAVTEAARGGLPWEVLYADDLVLMSDNEEDLMRKIAEWRGCLRSKGLKVNTGKTKVMVSAVGAGETRKAGDYPCGVCNKGVGSNSIQCTNCKNWVHRRCSDVKGSLAAAVDDFTCKKCKENLPRPIIAGDGEFMEVEGEKYGVVTSFCYLGDTLDGSGGADASTSARIRSGWKKFRELSPFLTSRAPSLKMKGKVFNSCVRSCMLYGSETWPMTVDCERRMRTVDNRMLRRFCGKSLRDRHSTDELRVMTGLEDITVCMRRNRLRWYGHVVRKEESDWVKRAWSGWDIEGRRPRGRPKKTWDATIKEDCSQLRLNREDAKNRAVWRSKIANVLPRDRDRGRKR